MRVFASLLAVVLCTACGQPGTPASPPPPPIASSSTAPAEVNPVRVERVRADLPTGYEVADLAGRAAPLALWGFGPAWAADPAQCGVLGDPAGEGARYGWSASGPGGIVYAAVAVAPVVPDPALTQACGTWTLVAGPTSGVVTLLGAPVIDGAATLGMAVDAATVVEGGTETHTHADTFVAYLDGHVAHVTVVTDPGASAPALPADFASDLLVQTVAAIRG